MQFKPNEKVKTRWLTELKLQAVRATMFRVVFIYMGIMFFASISVASNDEDLLSSTSRAAMSPFAIALKHAGWSGGPHLINAFIFTATFSATNSSIYIGSRTLYALADLGRAPKFLLKTFFGGVPVYAAIATNLVGLLALVNAASGAAKTFSYLISLSGAATFIAWGGIGVTHLRFRRAWQLQGHTPEELPFRAFLYPYGAYFISVLNIFLLFIQGYGTLLTPWHPVDFVFSYLVIVLFLFIFVFWKVYKKSKLVDLSVVDLQYGRRQFLSSDSEDEEKPSLFTRAIRSVKNKAGS